MPLKAWFAPPSNFSHYNKRKITHFDLPHQLESTEDRYEVLEDGAVIATEAHARSLATRWYTQEQPMNVISAG